MGSEQRLYTFTDETKEKLRKFRLSTSRAKEPQAVIYNIDKTTLEIKPFDGETHTSLQSIADDLPDNQPRFALLSYPMKTTDGRDTAPYVLLSYMPSTSNQQMRMLYAGAKELFRQEAQAQKVLEVDDEESVLDIEETLRGGGK